MNKSTKVHPRVNTPAVICVSKRKVHDATERLTIEITASDIANACPNDKNGCVIANALKRIPGTEAVEVGASTTTVWFGGDKGLRYKTPAKSRDGIIVYDETGKWPSFMMGIIHLDPPPKSMQLSMKRKTVKGTVTKVSNPTSTAKGSEPYGETGRNTPRKVNTRYERWASK